VFSNGLQIHVLCFLDKSPSCDPKARLPSLWSVGCRDGVQGWSERETGVWCCDGLHRSPLSPSPPSKRLSRCSTCDD